MCGIVGYIGFRNATDVLLKTLKRLEYRGYDSAGIAVVNGKLMVEKRKGYINAIKPDFKGTIGIGHTRWATHGVPSDVNAHPFVDCKGEIAIVHNGIIENFMEIKEKLTAKGHVFKSDTDSEVIAHLIEEYYIDSFKDAFIKAVNELKGSFAIAAIMKGQRRIMAAKKESPLVIGIGDHENFIASDIPAFLEYTNRVIVLKDGEICEVTDDFVNIYDLKGNEVKESITTIDWSVEDAEKSGYEHFMLKEIFEQPRALDDTLHALQSRDMPDIEFDRVHIVACGTSYHAGLTGKYVIEELLHVPVYVYYASEYRYMPEIEEKALTVFITQSGETADTIGAAKRAKDLGNCTIAITNVVGSSITNYVDHVLYTNAGPEIGVAATKTFTTQILVLYYFSIIFASKKGKISKKKANELLKELQKTGYYVERVLGEEEKIKKVAEEIASASSMYFIGRGRNYPIALEGALKMKEISYIHAEGYPAGELKHGPIALISDGMPVIAIVPEDELYGKMVSNIKEVSARNAFVVAVSSNKDVEKYADTVIFIPRTNYLFAPFVSAVALQLLSYHTAKILGRKIDKPKNLAKTVTVE